MALQLLRDFLAQRPGPEDENALQVLALQADHGQYIPNDVAAEHQKEQIEAGEDGEKTSAVGKGLEGAVRSRIAGGSDPGDEGAEKYSGQQHGDENGQRFVDARPTSADLIQTMEIEHDGPEDEEDGQEQEVAIELRQVANREDASPEPQVPGGEEGGQRSQEVTDEVCGDRHAVALMDQLCNPLRRIGLAIKGLGPHASGSEISDCARPMLGGFTADPSQRASSPEQIETGPRSSRRRNSPRGS